MLTIAIGFEEKVKYLILNFLWSGRKNKVFNNNWNKKCRRFRFPRYKMSIGSIKNHLHQKFNRR